MRTSAAMIVKTYFEKYIVVNLIKTKERKHSDPTLASSILSAAFDIVDEMKELIRSNNADDLKAIRLCLRKQMGIIRHELKDRQTFMEMIFKKVKLPRDFDTCLHASWYQLQNIEKQAKNETQEATDRLAA